MNVTFRNTPVKNHASLSRHLSVMGICAILLFTACRTSRNVCADCPIGEPLPTPVLVQQSTGGGGCPNCDRATTALYAFEEEVIRKDSIEAKEFEKSGRGPANPRATIQLDHAQEYIGRYTRHSPFVRLFMGKNYRSSFLFDTATLGAFASLYCQGKIDGLRAYIAKYDRNKTDPRANSATHYTIILVGTKRHVYSKDSVVYEDTLIATHRKANVYADLQDYSNPCKPTPCPGATLPAMPSEALIPKR